MPNGALGCRERVSLFVTVVFWFRFAYRMSLKSAFTAYTKGAGDMDGRTFTKILKDCKILDTKMTAVDADLIFAKVKAKGAKKITYAEFEEALRLVAAKKGVDIEAVHSKLASGKDSL